MPREKSIFTREYGIFLSTLRRLRKGAGVTQAAVGKAMGRDQSVVSKCERGQRRLDQIETMFYCKGMGMDYEEFVRILIADLKGSPMRKKPSKSSKWCSPKVDVPNSVGELFAFLLLNSARSLLPVAPPMHCLNIVGMVISPGSSHASWIDVVGNDVVVAGELHMAECAFPTLFDNLAVEQPSHLRVGTEFPVSPRMMGVFNPLYAQLIHLSDPWDWLPATAGQRAMDGTILIAAKFHWISSRWLCGRENVTRIIGTLFAGIPVAQMKSTCATLRDEVPYG
jgi:hypothetical protein